MVAPGQGRGTIRERETGEFEISVRRADGRSFMIGAEGTTLFTAGQDEVRSGTLTANLITFDEPCDSVTMEISYSYIPWDLGAPCRILGSVTPSA